MKAIPKHQKENLDAFTPWLLAKMENEKVVYLNECTIDINHIPLRALKNIVVKYNNDNKDSIPYYVGCKHSQQAIKDMVVYQKGTL